jgi:Response regulator containing a CheY-like receiver domain and an HTH DNA-binding domain
MPDSADGWLELPSASSALVDDEVVATFVVSSSGLFQDAIVGVFASSEECVLAGAAPLGDGVGRLIRASGADVAIIDGAVEALRLSNWIRSIHDQVPALRIMVAGADFSEDELLLLIESGACAHVPADATAEDLRAAVRDLHAGRVVSTPRIAALVAARIRQLLREKEEHHVSGERSLTLREEVVLRHLALGESNKEIALALRIEVHTVKTHVHNLYEKVHASSRRDAVRNALAAGLIREAEVVPGDRRSSRATSS